jgi:hypothetical protein
MHKLIMYNFYQASPWLDFNFNMYQTLNLKSPDTWYDMRKSLNLRYDTVKMRYGQDVLIKN